MSRSKPDETSQNPCTRWMQWCGDLEVKHGFKYWDKSKGEKGENVFLPVKMTFILLDELYTIKGYNEALKDGIVSNEIRNISTDILKVKFFNSGEIATGKYADIKDTIKAKSGKFAINCYVGYKNEEGKLVIGSIMMMGAALGPWIEFCQEVSKNDRYSKAIRVTGFTEGKKGKVEFKSPVFELADISPESNEEAKQLDIILQEHLSKYLSKNGTSNDSTSEVSEVKEEEETFSAETKPDKKGKEPSYLDETESKYSDDLPF